jgi:hypothetical protein
MLLDFDITYLYTLWQERIPLVRACHLRWQKFPRKCRDHPTLILRGSQLDDKPLTSMADSFERKATFRGLI